MPAGRPTKWSEELEQKAWDYIAGDWQREYDHAFPSLTGLCVVLNITKTTAYDWRDHEDKDFSTILAILSENSEHVLINRGLKGENNSNITKLVLGKFGYKEQKEVDQQVNLTAEHYLENLPPPDDSPSD